MTTELRDILTLDDQHVERFWAYVRKGDGCWEWTATKRGGYGLFRVSPGKSQMRSAHRIAWVLAYGPIPDGLLALHKCDNPACVKVTGDPSEDHLYLGTALDNMRDFWERDGVKDTSRFMRGESHYVTKLTENDIREIRRRIAEGEMQREVAERFGLQQPAVSRIVHRVTWAHVQ